MRFWGCKDATSDFAMTSWVYSFLRSSDYKEIDRFSLGAFFFWYIFSTNKSNYSASIAVARLVLSVGKLLSMGLALSEYIFGHETMQITYFKSRMMGFAGHVLHE